MLGAEDPFTKVELIFEPLESRSKCIIFTGCCMKDCQDAFEKGDIRNGDIYYLRPLESWNQTIRAVCEFDSSSGWTIFQRRLDGSVDFFRYWQDYVDGFGSLRGEYWIGK